jgi:hypothetical protein
MVRRMGKSFIRGKLGEEGCCLDGAQFGGAARVSRSRRSDPRTSIWMHGEMEVRLVICGLKESHPEWRNGKKGKRDVGPRRKATQAYISAPYRK